MSANYLRAGVLALLAAASLSVSAQTPTPATKAPAAKATAPTPTPTPTGAVLLRVNGEEVRQSQYDDLVTAMMRSQVQRMSAQAPPGSITPDMLSKLSDTIKNDPQVKGVLIDMTLFNQAIAKQIPNVKDAEVTSRIGDINKQLAEKGTTLEKYAADNDETMDEVRDDIRKEVAMELLFKEKGSPVEPTESDIKSFYDQHKDEVGAPQLRTSHILIGYPESAGDPRDPSFKPDPKIKADLKKKADDIYAKVKAGGNWEELVKANSSDTGSAANGGDVGFMPRNGGLVKPYEDAAWALKNDGEITPVVESQFGFHIIKRTGFKPARSYEEEHSTLRSYLIGQNVSTKRPLVIAKLHEGAKVDDLMGTPTLTKAPLPGAGMSMGGAPMMAPPTATPAAK